MWKKVGCLFYSRNLRLMYMDLYTKTNMYKYILLIETLAYSATACMMRFARYLGVTRSF